MSDDPARRRFMEAFGVDAEKYDMIAARANAESIAAFNRAWADAILAKTHEGLCQTLLRAIRAHGKAPKSTTPEGLLSELLRIEREERRTESLDRAFRECVASYRVDVSAEQYGWPNMDDDKDEDFANYYRRVARWINEQGERQ